MIYLDNAATSFPKPRSVIKEVKRCITKYCGNPGRSSHALAMMAAEKIYEARETVSSLLGDTGCENICFFSNATYALNCVINGLIQHKCHVITSDIEHNSSLRVLKQLEKNGRITLSYFNNSTLSIEDLEKVIKADTRFAIVNAVSNVTGEEIDLSLISNFCKNHGISLVVDATQLLGHKPFDIKKYSITALCSAGHKGLLGIQGSAFAYIKSGVDVTPLAYGGSGIDTFNPNMPDFYPDRLEAGTLSTPAIASLCEGIKFIRSVSEEAFEYKINKLTSLLYDRISAIPNSQIYGCNNGIIAFNINRYTSLELSNLLSDNEIATRGGYHCAPLLHKRLGTEKIGAVRASVSYFNSVKDLDRLYVTLKNAT